MKRWLAVGVVGALAAVGTAGAQEAGGEPVPEPPAALEPAPPELPGQVTAIYRAASQALQNLEALGPTDGAELPETASEFEASVAALTDDQLAMLYAATREVEAWPTIAGVYQDLASQTATAAQAVVEPPPPEPAPGVPIEAATLYRCPSQPPGTNFGNDATYSVSVVSTALEAIAGAIPNPIHTGEEQINIPNPILGVIVTVIEVTHLVSHTLDWLKDRYFYCEGENQYLQNANADVIAPELWSLLQVAEGTLHNLNDGVIAVSRQVRDVQGAADELLLTDIQQALILPVGSPPNVSYELPTAHGGYLDASPVGVQGIVTDALAAARRAGLPINAVAPTYLAQADTLLAQGRYVPAYQMYQRAYQGLLG